MTAVPVREPLLIGDPTFPTSYVIDNVKCTNRSVARGGRLVGRWVEVLARTLGR